MSDFSNDINQYISENLNDIPDSSKFSEQIEQSQDNLFQEAIKQIEQLSDTSLDDYSADTIYNDNGAVIREFTSAFDTTEEISESSGEYLIDGYYVTDGVFDGFTFPPRLDTTAADAFEANSDHIIGEPMEDTGKWHQQEMPYSCAVCCQEFAIESLLDIDLNESEFREIAKEHGYTDDGGTPFLNAGDVAKEFGLQSELNFDFNLETLSERIANGEKIIVGIDNSMLYFPDNNSPFLMPQANHAVEITGFDTSDPNDIKVIINDPGYENGAGNVYSWDYFNSCSANMYITIHK